MAAPKPLTVRSPTFNEGQTLPTSAVHDSAGGQDISPELSWDAPPPGTKTYPKFRFMTREHVLAQGTLTARFGRPAR